MGVPNADTVSAAHTRRKAGWSPRRSRDATPPVYLVEACGDIGKDGDMAELEVSGGEVQVRLTTAEKIFALRGDYAFPLRSVTSVEVFDQGLDAVRGIRAPGMAIPWRRAVGTWRRWAGKELVSVRRGQPAVRVTLDGEHFGAVVIGVDDAARIESALTASR